MSTLQVRIMRSPASRFLVSFCNDRRGGIAAFFALSLVPLVGMTGAAIDYSRASWVRTSMQAALDAAALAGVIIQTDEDSARILQAKKMFAAGFPEAPTLEPAVSIEDGRVTVSAQMNVETKFMGVLGINSMSIGGTSTAVQAAGAVICVLGLHGSAEKDISTEGRAKLTAEKCAVHSNSKHSQALSTFGNSTSTAEKFCTVGGYTGSGFSPTPKEGCAPVNDPFVKMPTPSKLSCDFNNVQVVGGTFKATPGVYCGGLKVTAGAKVALSPGLYVVRDGPLRIDAHSTITGKEVTFYFYGTNAVLDFKSHSELDITAPKTGDYAGMAIAQHRTSSVGATSNIEGGGSLRIVGALYLPTQVLDIGGKGTFGAKSPYMPLVAARIHVRGNATLKVSADYEEGGFTDRLARTREGARLLY